MSSTSFPTIRALVVVGWLSVLATERVGAAEIVKITVPAAAATPSCRARWPSIMPAL